MEKFNFYWNTLIKNIEWIKFSESKAIFLMTIYGVIITITYSNANSVYSALQPSSFQIILVTAIVLSSIISLYFCFKTLNPQLKNDDPNSIIYFGHIQEKFKTAKEYLEYSNNLIEDENLLLENIAAQVYTTSKIAWRKFKNVSLSIRFFITSIALLITEILFYILSI